jgi:hypothetical protein
LSIWLSLVVAVVDITNTTVAVVALAVIELLQVSQFHLLPQLLWAVVVPAAQCLPILAQMVLTAFFLALHLLVVGVVAAPKAVVLVVAAAVAPVHQAQPQAVLARLAKGTTAAVDKAAEQP